MQRTPLALAALLIGTLVHGQAARIVFNSAATTLGQHPFVVFNPDPSYAANPGTYLVIGNPNANAITLTGVTSDVPIIKSEAEQNKIRWATSTSTGTYVVPYASGTTTAGVAMPLTVQITGAGAGGTDPSLVLSTYNSIGKTTGSPVVTGWNNNNYRPTDVTHMNSSVNNAANSMNAIDRFWIIDAGEGSYAYGTKPAVSLTFAYDPAEAAVNGGNTPGLAGLLLAQRFNSSVNFWYDVAQMGTTGVNVVSNAVPPTPGNFYRSWTLANVNNPLPIRLVAWDGQCQGGAVALRWTTASEQDNAYFTIEKSLDAQAWAAIGTVTGAGNSSHAISYSYLDHSAHGQAYYQLRQTDINGVSTVSNAIAAGCGAENGTAIVNAWDDGDYLNLVVSSTMDGVYDLTLLDAQGKIMTARSSQTIGTGTTTLRMDKRGIATGIYVARLSNSANTMSRRVHLD